MVHTLRNALDKLPSKLHDHAKALLQEMFNALTVSDKLTDFVVFKKICNDKYHKVSGIH